MTLTFDLGGQGNILFPLIDYVSFISKLTFHDKRLQDSMI